MKPIAFFDLLIDYFFKFTKIAGTGTEKLFFQSDLQDHIGRSIPDAVENVDESLLMSSQKPIVVFSFFADLCSSAI